MLIDGIIKIAGFYAAIITCTYIMITKHPLSYRRMSEFIQSEKFNTLLALFGVPVIINLITFYITGRRDFREFADSVCEIYLHIMGGVVVFYFMGYIFRDTIDGLDDDDE